MLLGVLVSDQRRGAEVFATDLGAALVGRGRTVRNVALVSTGAGPTLDVPGLSHRLGPATVSALRREVLRSGMVIAHGSRTLPACALAALGTDRPFVYRSIGDPAYWSSGPLRRSRTGFLLGRAAAVAVLWQGAASTLTDRQGVPPEKIRVIPNGVPATRFPLVDAAARASARAHLDLAAEQQVVAYVGALSPEKMVHLAVAAMQPLSDAVLVVAGAGPERARLGALAAEFLPGRIRFLGATPEPSRVLATADALVLPSRTEGMPAVLIEAGLSGVPVVATAVGAVPEVVVDGVTGRLVPVGDVEALSRTLHSVLSDPGRLGTSARQHCLEHFEIGVVAAMWDRFLSDVLASRHRNGVVD